MAKSGRPLLNVPGVLAARTEHRGNAEPLEGRCGEGAATARTWGWRGCRWWGARGVHFAMLRGGAHGVCSIGDGERAYSPRWLSGFGRFSTAPHMGQRKYTTYSVRVAGTISVGSVHVGHVGGSRRSERRFVTGGTASDMVCGGVPICTQPNVGGQ